MDSSNHERQLAEQILNQALGELRRESLQVGRLDLFERLLPCLLDARQLPPDSADGSSAEARLALQRLRERLRERVNAHLRQQEPDTERRRALRRRLQTALSTARDPA